MRKLVNGRIVDIQNIELFELAAEGIAKNSTLTNIIPNESLKIDFTLAEKCIEVYKRFYSSLPFPLYGIDSDLKYCCAGLYIKRCTGIDNTMWTDNGLYITIDEDKLLALGFINNSWGIVSVDCIKACNLNIQDYKGAVGFSDFIWVLGALSNNQSTSGYYREFMAKFVEACNNQPMVLKWELSNILVFGNIPERIELKSDKIVDLDGKSEYSLDIFVAGIRETGEKQYVWNLSSEDDMELRSKTVKVYGYDLYMKPTEFDSGDIKPGDDKLKRASLIGMNSLFCSLCSIKQVTGTDDFDHYKGLISDNNLVYSIRNRVFVAKTRKYVEPKEIARGVEIYSCKQNIVYLCKPKIVTPGVRKEVIYSYSLADESLRLCKIQFVRV